MITVQYESIVIGAGSAGSTATYGVVSVSYSFAKLPGYGGIGAIIGGSYIG